MRKLWMRVRRWFPGHGLYFCFALVFLAGGVVLLSSLLGCVHLKTDEIITLFSGLLTGGVVWWQGHLLARQLAYGTVLELCKEWNSNEMIEKRSAAWIVAKEGPNPETIEEVLEFLEKVSTLERDRYISRRFIWDTFGWYVGRYFYYCREEIQNLRTYWTGKEDRTLYCDLERFYARLIEFEAGERNLEPKAIEEEYYNTRGKFIKAEGTAE
jgi:hypothetical protein